MPRPLTFGLLVLFCTGLLLVIPARHQMSAMTAGILLLHIGLGLLLLLPLLIALKRHFQECSTHGVARLAFGVSLVLCAVGGGVLLIRPLRGESNAHATIYWFLHVGSGAVFSLLWIQKSVASLKLSRPLPTTVLLLLLPLIAWGGADSTLYQSGIYLRTLSATAPKQADNPLFPSALRIANDLPTARRRWQEQNSAYCTREGCHTQAGIGWTHSAHAHSAEDPFYQKVAATYANKSRKDSEKWCWSCHNPQATIEPSAYILRGVDCLACHATTEVAPRTGNGEYTLTLPDNYPFATASEGWQKSLHSFLIRVRPQAHQGTYLKPLLKTSEFCASCHQQSYSVAQNGYRTLPTDTTASEWLSSPFAPHTLGIPHNGGAKTCQECHFQTHASPASNATLASLRGDTEHLNATQKSLQSSRLQLDIFAPSPPAGQPVRLDIVVHNSSIGHDFPSGYTDIKDIWLEVLVKESTGRVLFESRGEKGEPTHRWGHIGLDRSGGRILRNNRSDEITSLQHRTIKAGESDIARYTFSLPKGERREYSVTARLLHRSHRPEFVQWVLPQKRLSLPITLLAETTATLFAPNTIPPQDLAKRYIRYGNALLTPKEPDLQGAIRAFRTAQTLFPQNVEGSLGLADAYLREPALLSARNQFVQVLREKPNHKGAIFGLGKVLGRQGQFQQALQQLLPLATEAHSDLRLWSEIGVISYQQGDYTSSVHALQKALSLQPQDPKLHYQLKQSFQRLQQVAEARREETILKFLTERRWETTILTEYLRLNPADKTLQRGIPEYVLLPMKQGNVPTKSK